MRKLWQETTTVFSPDRIYRYSLERVLLPFGQEKNRVTFVMLNPSTADENEDDPTIRRCLGFARNWGYVRLRVVNIFALRSTDPKALYKHADPIGPDNLDHISEAAANSEMVVCAWGVHGALMGQGKAVKQWLWDWNNVPMTLGETKDGHPKHPLYLPSDVTPGCWV